MKSKNKEPQKKEIGHVFLQEVHKDDFYIGQIVPHDIFMENGILFLKGGSPITEKMKERLNQMKERLFSLDISKHYDDSVIRIREMMEKINRNESVNKNEIAEMTAPFFREILYNRGFIHVLTTMRNKDEYTFQHNIHVSIFAMTLAKWLNYSLEDIQAIGQAGVLHDIGKSFIPLEILNKPAPLTQEEFQVMKSHSFYGYEYLCRQGFSEITCKGALEHHEKMNGSGYPDGKSGEEINEYAQLIAVADIYHAMISKRVYKNAINPFAVLRYISTLYEEYNPRFLMIFVSNMLQSLVGIKVRLNNGREGEVLYINKDNMERPMIRCLDNGEILDLNQNLHLEIFMVE